MYKLQKDDSFNRKDVFQKLTIFYLKIKKGIINTEGQNGIREKEFNFMNLLSPTGFLC